MFCFCRKSSLPNTHVVHLKNLVNAHNPLHNLPNKDHEESSVSILLDNLRTNSKLLDTVCYGHVNVQHLSHLPFVCQNLFWIFGFAFQTVQIMLTFQNDSSKSNLFLPKIYGTQSRYVNEVGLPRTLNTAVSWSTTLVIALAVVIWMIHSWDSRMEQRNI